MGFSSLGVKDYSHNSYQDYISKQYAWEIRYTHNITFQLLRGSALVSLLGMKSIPGTLSSKAPLRRYGTWAVVGGVW
jgi:hypothetical protein